MKTILGTVISDKMNGSAIILTERRFRHPKYGKIMRSTNKLHVANQIGAKVGQKVRVVEGRPLSKTIAFRILEIIVDQKEKKETPALTPTSASQRSAKKAKATKQK